MPKKWLYFPFKDISGDNTISYNLNRYKEKYKENIIEVYLDGDLSKVGDDDMLIIGGHGDPNKSILQIMEPKSWMHLFSAEADKYTIITHNNIANQLVNSQLPLTHKYIKLISCGGAGMSTMNETGQDLIQQPGGQLILKQKPNVTSNSCKDCLASALAVSLYNSKYNNILVKGYPGFVVADRKEKLVAIEATSEKAYTFKSLRRAYWKGGGAPIVYVPTKNLNDYWFNGKGELVRQHISLKNLNL